MTLEHILVDNCAMALVQHPRASTRSSPRTRSATSCPTRRRSWPARWACCPRRLARRARCGLYEPVHGTAPGHRGQGDRQPDRGDPVGGDAAALLAEHGPRRRPDRRRRCCACSSRGTGRRTSPGRRHERRSARREMGDLIVRARWRRAVLMAWRRACSVAVVGATGAVGQTTLRILEERKFPVRELRCFASERSVGKTVTFQGEAIRSRRSGRARSRASTSRFCSAGSAQSKEYAPHDRQGGRDRRRQVERVPHGPDGAAGGAGDQRARGAAPRRASSPARTARPSSP